MISVSLPVEIIRYLESKRDVFHAAIQLSLDPEVPAERVGPCCARPCATNGPTRPLEARGRPVNGKRPVKPPGRQGSRPKTLPPDAKPQTKAQLLMPQARELYEAGKGTKAEIAKRLGIGIHRIQRASRRSEPAAPNAGPTPGPQQRGALRIARIRSYAPSATAA